MDMDKNTPLSLLEARNAVRIAKSANADEYAESAFQNAQQSLNQAEDYYQRKQNTKSIDTVARAAVQSAETARVTALKAKNKHVLIVSETSSPDAPKKRARSRNKHGLILNKLNSRRR
jgi:1,2-phenylacetyl-CoA epoxidase PaaB subunit